MLPVTTTVHGNHHGLMIKYEYLIHDMKAYVHAVYKYKAITAVVSRENDCFDHFKSPFSYFALRRYTYLDGRCYIPNCSEAPIMHPLFDRFGDRSITKLGTQATERKRLCMRK